MSALDDAVFRTLVEQSLAGVYVVQDGRLVYANRRMGDLFGYAVSDLLALQSVFSLVSDRDRSLVGEKLRQRIEGEVDHVEYEMRGRRSDGSHVDLQVLSVRMMYEGRPAVAGTMIDVTAQRRLAAGQAERERRYRDLIENASDTVFTFDLDGRITWINRTGERLTGYSLDELRGMSLVDLAPPSHRATVRELVSHQPAAHPAASGELTVVTRTGAQIVLEVTTRPVNVDGVIREVQGIARDVTARKQQEATLQSLTLIDELTGCYNRRGFLTLAERHLKLAIRKKQRVFLLFADLDGLKGINDTFGHAEGDRALAAAADLLKATYRSVDIVARLGGDEFTVFPIEAADESAERLVARLADHIDAYNTGPAAPRGYRLGLSVGVTRFDPDQAWSVAELLERADRALYETKGRRRTELVEDGRRAAGPSVST